MKNTTTTLLLVIFTMATAVAQIPNDHYFRFDFQNKSLINHSPGDAIDLGTRENVVLKDLEDRFGDPQGAVEITVAPFNGLANPVPTIGTSAQALSFWVKRDQLTNTSDGRIISIYQNAGSKVGFKIRFQRRAPDNKFKIYHELIISSSNRVFESKETAAPLDDSEWHHIIYQVDYEATQDSADFSFYIDGTKDTALSTRLFVGKNWKFMNNSQFPLRIGNTMGIDDVRYYERALSATERDLLYTEKPMKRIYVDANASGDNTGADWANAFTDAQTALTHAYKGSEVWVAEGTYTRERDGDNQRNYAFIWLHDSIKLYGGFNGTETALSQRDWNTNPTIFSGNFENTVTKTDNALAVFVGPFLEGTFGYIDGIKITDGYADGGVSEFGGSGSAIYLGDYGDAHFKNIEIYNNYAEAGVIGAFIFSTDRKYTFENMDIHDNDAKGGTAFFLRTRPGAQSLTATWINCLIHDNTSRGSLNYYGAVGALAQDAGILRNDFINCTFANNKNLIPSTTGEGNILTSGTNITMNMYNCIMSGNGNESDLGPNQAKVPSLVNIVNSILNDSELPLAWTLVDNEDVSPRFTDSLNGDYTLTKNSPAVNAGTLNIIDFIFPSTDFAGNPRNLSKSIDIGCYEYQGNVSIKNQILNAVNVYPNPTSAMLTIEQGAERYTRATIQDMSGKTVKSYIGKVSSVDVSTLPTGIYLIQLSSATQTSYARFIKH